MTIMLNLLARGNKSLASTVYTVIYHISTSAKFVHSFAVSSITPECVQMSHTNNNVIAKLFLRWDDKDYSVQSITLSF
jgi:hypothetical protein